MEQRCTKCGQDLPVAAIDHFSTENLRSALVSQDYDWDDYEAGAVLYPFTTALVTLTVVDKIVNWDTDSYNDTVGDGQVIFRLEKGLESKTFRIKGDHSSYNGWDWDLWTLVQVKETPKTILSWETV
jgi:hypothetical protein